MCKVSTKFLKWFGRRWDNGENQRWLPVAIFADGPEPFRPNRTRPLGEHLRQVLKTSDQGSWRRGDSEKKFTEVWTDGWTPDGLLLDKLYLSVKLKTQT